MLLNFSRNDQVIIFGAMRTKSTSVSYKKKEVLQVHLNFILITSSQITSRYSLITYFKMASQRSTSNLTSSQERDSERSARTASQKGSLRVLRPVRPAESLICIKLTFQGLRNQLDDVDEDDDEHREHDDYPTTCSDYEDDDELLSPQELNRRSRIRASKKKGALRYRPGG